MSYPFNSGPIAPERNPPIEPENFKPSRFEISDIDLGVNTTVTTDEDHNYVIGQLVRFLIPPTFGTRQLNEITGYVTSIPASTQVVVNIDSRDFNSFIANPSFGPTPPQILAIGDINTPSPNASGRSSVTTFIPGSFRNISPQ